MKKLSFGIIAMLLLGAGCPVALPWVHPETQTAVTPSDAAQSPSIPKAPNGWRTYENVVRGFLFSYPEQATWNMGGYNLEDTVASFDLGSQVTSMTAQSVPTTELAVRVIPTTDLRIKDCFFSESRWPEEATGIQTTHVSLGGRDVCLTVESDAGAGNYYSSYAYSVINGNEVIILDFVVHSVNCLNYEDPESQCVAFDETRDTKEFEGIVGTLGFTGEPEASAIDMTLFEQISKTDNTSARQISLTYPHLSTYPDNAAQTEFNRLVDEHVSKAVAQFKKDVGDSSPEEIGSASGPWYLAIDAHTFAAPKGRVSVVFTLSEYLGGAHPNTFYETLVFNFNTKKEETLAEFFNEGVDYIQAVSDYSVNELKRRYDMQDLTDDDWIQNGAGPSANNYMTTYLSDSGVVVLFPPYQVAAYAAGPSEVVVPYSVLQGKISL
ncbi:MAG: DUF3298 domain-containing protein [Patescibacteria group bacterium]